LEALVKEDVTEGIVIGVFTAVLVLAVAALIYLFMLV
jgi:hypothetical protein